ncbi:sporulation histidine kinase inhibitor Sda [Tumebacillus sp. DT12]|uniref:Sporulation histidine kinase inhibitor Sda n=1 Tax=Tumebacillus lacus TaxID=2995335 RepID=A0ABT3X188_9BACL|nr:sporulation histidine kinase inhibitor Sda [Tumebacillus lacus]MCX7570692.1 sporulation histidine kinase inhibitor Sda [Tumebacillus lacus]
MHLLTDDFLLEAYRNAVRQKLDTQFIELLFLEIHSRGLAVPVTIAS